ncbi:hypothetical protein OFEAOIEE_LOCUS4079 [Methylorubrum extorquens]
MRTAVAEWPETKLVIACHVPTALLCFFVSGLSKPDGLKVRSASRMG